MKGKKGRMKDVCWSNSRQPTLPIKFYKDFVLDLKGPQNQAWTCCLYLATEEWQNTIGIKKNIGTVETAFVITGKW